MKVQNQICIFVYIKIEKGSLSRFLSPVTSFYMCGYALMPYMFIPPSTWITCPLT